MLRRLSKSANRASGSTTIRALCSGFSWALGMVKLSAASVLLMQASTPLLTLAMCGAGLGGMWQAQGQVRSCRLTRWTSRGRSVTGRSAATTRGPMVMFGTKRPSCAVEHKRHQH